MTRAEKKAYECKRYIFFIRMLAKVLNIASEVPEINIAL